MQKAVSEPASQTFYQHQHGMNNVMDANKLAYIKGMRIELCEQDILKRGTGELNVKYFNVKKGSYWSEREDELLL